MPGLAALAAIAICGGAALAATVRDRRMAILGVSIALVAAPLVGSEAPDLLSLAFREIAVVSGAYLLWIVTGRDEPTDLRADGPAVSAPFVVLAFVSALAVGPALGPDRGPVVGLAAAASAAMAALALGIGATQVVAGGLSAIMLLLAASLALTGLAGAGGPLHHAVIGTALLAVMTAAAFVGSVGRRPPAAAPPEQPTLFDHAGE